VSVWVHFGFQLGLSSKMEQITTSLVARPAPKSAVSGSGTEAAGSVTKRSLVVLTAHPS
jgi:hypothetical protein